jgi:hypothetical protein
MLLDVTPAEQLSEANAWVGRMTHMGSIRMSPLLFSRTSESAFFLS